MYASTIQVPVDTHCNQGDCKCRFLLLRLRVLQVLQQVDQPRLHYGPPLGARASRVFPVLCSSL
ncbi:hypothetical protein K523DRAFT_419088 [Schizophyllum commune Tattone D]|nr:hypothetical protein K523DRAFT_419088 [Schizophyllum commune Tattone D]